MPSSRATEVDDKQYQAWGVLVRNANLKSAHLANGLIQTLRALPKLAVDPPDWGDRDVPQRFDAAVREVLRTISGADGWTLSDAAVSLAVTKSKSGPTLLTGEVAPATPRDKRVVAAGLAHLRDVFAGSSPRLTRHQHELLEGSLNADGTVRVSGAADPTTPGLCLSGYTSTHTLKPMHAATFLGALAQAGSRGWDLLARLHALAQDERDPHSRLVRELGLQTASLWPPLEASPALQRALPFPTGPAWQGFPRVAEQTTSRLLAWSHQGASKQEVLMATIDLAGLLLVLRILGATAAPDRALLLVCPTGKSASSRYAIEVGRRTLRAAQHRLDSIAVEQGLVTEGRREKWAPSRAARTLALATGWLYPRHAQGGARHHLSPGPRQVVTMCKSLVEPGEDIDWWTFHKRALELGVVLGGAEEARAAEFIGGTGSREALRRAGEINQSSLIELGLARHESDGVVRVSGGA